MNNNHQYVIKKKHVSELLAQVPSNSMIVTGLGPMAAHEFLSQLHTIPESISNVHVVSCLLLGNYEFYTNPQYKERLFSDTWFYTGLMRKHHHQGNLSFLPNHLHLAATKLSYKSKPTIYVGSASPMDQHGYFTLSLSNVYEKHMLKIADMVFLEVNPNFPRTHGDTEIHINDIDAFTETEYMVPTLPINAPSERDLKIGVYISEYINDGDCIQLGIGNIPNAVANSLYSKKDLGIHTEMITDSMVDLVLSNVITGKKKNFNTDKIIGAFAYGSQKLYDFLNDNPSVQIRDGFWVNDPYIIAQNDNMVSINTTIEVDLTGQCCSESIGHQQVSGTGGQADTAIGAQMAKNGRSFIALHSTATILDRTTGISKEISKIVPFLKQGAIVSLSRNDVDYVVTEYGVASLKGTSVKERVERLIAIAHPDFREELKHQAQTNSIW